jgi:hypothetical protein
MENPLTSRLKKAEILRAVPDFFSLEQRNQRISLQVKRCFSLPMPFWMLGAKGRNDRPPD